jgi:hypothetical protein
VFLLLQKGNQINLYKIKKEKKRKKEQKREKEKKEIRKKKLKKVIQNLVLMRALVKYNFSKKSQ